MRKAHLSLIAVLAILMTVLSAPDLARAARYEVTDLGTLGGTESFPHAINNRGQIVGASRLAGDSLTHAFLYTKGTMADLAPLNSGSIQTVGPTGINNETQIASGVVVDGIYFPAVLDAKTDEIRLLGSLGGVAFGQLSGVATAINNYGQVVGAAYVDDTNRHAFVYHEGVLTDIGSLGGYSQASGINDNGVIVGFSSDETGYAHAFLYRFGRMSELSPFGGPNNEGYARAVNNLGEVVGTALNSAGDAFHAFIYWDGRVTDIGTLPGGRYSEAYAINERGQVVGVADYPYPSTCWDPLTYQYVPCIEYAQSAFLYENGQLTDLNSLVPPNSGWTLEWAFDINSRGQIIGWGLHGGRYRGFVLTPKPSSRAAR